MTRQEITDIIGVIGDSEKFSRWHNQDRFQQEVVPILPAELKVIELPSGHQFQSNCFALALNLQCISCENEFHDGFVYPDFVEKIIFAKELVKIDGQPELGDIVLYRQNGHLKHAGVVAGNDLVRSKWGIGPVLEHPLMSTPLYYGDEIEYFKGISEQKARALFETYKNFNLP